MRDPYELLGVTPDSTIEEVRRAYRQAIKKVHPDKPENRGRHEETVELNTAYAFILNELKKRMAQEGQAARARRSAESDGSSSRSSDKGTHTSATQEERKWNDYSRQIDEELEALRRASEQYEAQMRAKQRAAWQAGDRVTWAKLTWDDFFAFFTRTASSGLKGIGLLAAALLGIGSWLLELNLVSAFILAGSLIGFALSVALKSDKGGLMSAVLVLLGLLTVWVPPTRSLLFSNPMATISVLVCLALILKFAREAGRAGLMTGGVVALYLIATIISQVNPQIANSVGSAIPKARVPVVAQPTVAPPTSAAAENKQSSGPQQPQAVAAPPKPPAPAPVEPRELTAALGVKLVFNPDVPYQLKIRSGMTTILNASEGTIALYRGDQKDGECEASVTFTSPTSSFPYSPIDRWVRSCGSRAIFDVTSVQ